jgi:hypothetical protein
MDVTKLAAIPFLNQAELPGQGAVGQLQATQAGNQLLGVQSRQLKSHRTDAWLLSSVEHLCGLRLIGLAVGADRRSDPTLNNRRHITSLG